MWRSQEGAEALVLHPCGLLADTPPPPLHEDTASSTGACSCPCAAGGFEDRSEAALQSQSQHSTQPPRDGYAQPPHWGLGAPAPPLWQSRGAGVWSSRDRKWQPSSRPIPSWLTPGPHCGLFLVHQVSGTGHRHGTLTGSQGLFPPHI